LNAPVLGLHTGRGGPCVLEYLREVSAIEPTAAGRAANKTLDFILQLFANAAADDLPASDPCDSSIASRHDAGSSMAASRVMNSIAPARGGLYDISALPVNILFSSAKRSNLVGCSPGIWPGLVPRIFLST